MDFESALVQELEALLPGKVFPMSAPEGVTAPYIIYTSVQGSQVQTLSGFVTLSGGTPEINVLHETYSGLKALTAQVIAKMKTFEGRQIGTNGPFIQEISYSEPVPIYEAEAELYRCMIEFTIHY